LQRPSAGKTSSEASHQGKENNVEKRKFKRYTYKPDRCPVFICRETTYKVLNISQGGLKIEVQSSPEMPSDAYIFDGYLHFSNGSRIPVSGRQMWIIGDEIGIKLDTPLSETLIDAEADCFQNSP
jgi:hypothetical protein